MPLSAEEKACVFDELASPLDIKAVVARADTPEHAAEIYAASLVAITADTAAERAYLDALASKLQRSIRHWSPKSTRPRASKRPSHCGTLLRRLPIRLRPATSEPTAASAVTRLCVLACRGAIYP